MGLGEHLAELRTRLIRAVLCMAVVFGVLYGYRHMLLGAVQEPMLRSTAMLRTELSDRLQGEYQARIDQGETVDASVDFEPGWPKTWVLRQDRGPTGELLYMHADGGFFLRMRVCFWLALAISGPYLLWELWGFIAAGLYKKEKKVAYAYFPVSLVLFFSGILFGYYVLVPYALYFLNLDGLGHPGGDYRMGAEQYLNFLKGLCLALGFVFQLPILMVAVSRLGLVQPKTYSHYRKHMLVGSLVIGAILTPPDPVTQLLMAGPIILLYEVGLRVAYWTWQEPFPESEPEHAAQS